MKHHGLVRFDQRGKRRLYRLAAAAEHLGDGGCQVTIQGADGEISVNLAGDGGAGSAFARAGPQREPGRIEQSPGIERGRGA